MSRDTPFSFAARQGQRSQLGLTLIELALVFVIIAIILSAALSSGDQKKNYARLKQTYDKMEKIEEALVNYVKLNGKLPCPEEGGAAKSAYTNFGDGRCTAATTITVSVTETLQYYNVAYNSNFSQSYAQPDIYVGALPFRALGLPEAFMVDGWGNRFTYVVEAPFTNRTSFAGRYFGNLNAMLDFETIQVFDSGGQAGGRQRTNVVPTSVSATPPTPLNDRVGAAVLIISHGANNFCSWPKTGGAQTMSGARADPGEEENCISFTGNNKFSQDMPSSTFDDIVHYYSKDRLMLLAGISPVDPNACRQADITLEPYFHPCNSNFSYYASGPAGCEVTNQIIDRSLTPGDCPNQSQVDTLNPLCMARQLRLANLLKERCP